MKKKTDSAALDLFGDVPLVDDAQTFAADAQEPLTGEDAPAVEIEPTDAPEPSGAHDAEQGGDAKGRAKGAKSVQLPEVLVDGTPPEQDGALTLARNAALA